MPSTKLLLAIVGFVMKHCGVGVEGVSLRTTKILTIFSPVGFRGRFVLIIMRLSCLERKTSLSCRKTPNILTEMVICISHFVRFSSKENIYIGFRIVYVFDLSEHFVACDKSNAF